MEKKTTPCLKKFHSDSEENFVFCVIFVVFAMELTFIMIKPDGVQRGLVGEIISRFEKKGFSLKGLKIVSVEREFAERHYADLSTKPFFNGLVEYIISGPVVAMIWEGKNVVATGRQMIGATNPAASNPGTIRGDYAIDIGRNGGQECDTWKRLGGERQKGNRAMVP